ncbi:MAG: phosphopantothenoylcysteine decarboxylase [Phycisphaeraceae bacterium]|nr:phosphopantothenoylcysteine decarboxylase [Phycisphaeraceae bacterium]
MSQSSHPSWKDRKIVLAVSGGIACYKSAALASRLVQAGAQLQVLMTEAATHFVGPLTFQTLSSRPVITSIWQPQESFDSEHVTTARWAQLVIVAPCTSNTLAKIAAGLADDVVSLTLAALPRTTPVLLAPAMNAQMWESPITQRNLKTVRELLGHQTVGPDEGWQACRTVGPGRMSEPDAIFAAAEKLLPDR